MTPDHMVPNRSYTFPVDSILLLGPTGVGKSPLGDVIAQHGIFGRRCHHLDFGSELRDAVSRVDRMIAYAKKELDFIHGVLELGLLLENEHFPLAKKIISLYLDRVGFLEHNVLVLNGIPRHAGQARDIATLAAIHAVVVLDCSPNDVMCRIRDNVGGDRTERIDDNKELIENKLTIFQERTRPLIEHYTQRGCALYRISVSGDMTPIETYYNVSSLAAAYPPVTLVTEPPQR
jgi:adenylate kinase